MPGVWTENTLRHAGLETALLFVRHVPGEVHKFSNIQGPLQKSRHQKVEMKQVLGLRT